MPEKHLFDPLTGELRPECRDAYLRGQLPAGLVDTLETYIKKSPIQTRILLGRYHELAAQARQRGHSLVAPLWVGQQLLYQPSASRVGPLRRPVVRVVLGLFGLLLVASIVQWLRNEPLVPAPVVAAVSRVAASASRATEQVVARFTSDDAPPAPKPAPRPAAPAAPRPAAASRPAPRPAPQVVQPLEPQPAAVATLALPTDSAAAQLPATLPTVRSNRPTASGGAAPASSIGNAARPAPAGLVQGRIADATGRSLAGATVLVKGTTLATSANATGFYSLQVPAGAMLQFGYAGCLDRTLPNTGTGTMNVVLQPTAKRRPTRR